MNYGDTILGETNKRLSYATYLVWGVLASGPEFGWKTK